MLINFEVGKIGENKLSRCSIIRIQVLNGTWQNAMNQCTSNNIMYSSMDQPKSETFYVWCVLNKKNMCFRGSNAKSKTS